MPVDVEVNVTSSPVSGDCGANENDAVGAACAEGAAIHIVMTTTRTFRHASRCSRSQTHRSPAWRLCFDYWTDVGGGFLPAAVLSGYVGEHLHVVAPVLAVPGGVAGADRA